MYIYIYIYIYIFNTDIEIDLPQRDELHPGCYLAVLRMVSPSLLDWCFAVPRMISPSLLEVRSGSEKKVIERAESQECHLRLQN